MKTSNSGWIKPLSQLACVAVSAGSLWLVFHKQPVGKLWMIFKRTDPLLWTAGVGVFGLAILCSAIRWHLILRMTGCATHFAATARTTFVSHTFSVFLFGPLGADVGRTTLYSRWFHQPMPRILLSISLDRIVTFLGWGTFVGMGMIIAVQKGFVPLGKLASQMNPGWLAAVIGLGAAAGWMVLRQVKKSNSILGRAGRPFLDGLKQLASRPGITATGWLVTLASQIVLVATSILFLQAVSLQPIPWVRILWIFPVIMFLGTLPVSAAGLGVREGASMVMLGWLHIPPEDAVAASLLTFTAFLIWAVPGAVILARHEREHRKPARPVAGTISVVIPALNEAAELPATLERLSRVPEVREIIIVDGGSRDGTMEVATRAGCRVLSCAPGRGGQMRLGAGSATCDILLFLHADSWVTPQAGSAILSALKDTGVVGGGFWKVFREKRFLMRGSRFRCASRLYFGGLILGDQGFFVLRGALEAVGGVPDMPLMEEFELCRRLRKSGRLALADAVVTTSARRFLEHGILRTYGRMWRLAIAYQFGKRAEALKPAYDRKA